MSDISALVQQLPGPLARPFSRIPISAEGRDLFENSFIAFEAFLKYLTTICLCALHSIDPDESYTLEFRLSRASSLGEWNVVLKACLDALSRARTADWVFKIQSWASKNDRKDPHLAIVIDKCELILAHLKKDGEDYDEKIISKTSAINFLIFVRNKTRGHGAKTEYFYHQQCANLTAVVVSLAEGCPALVVALGARIVSKFQECVWLKGTVPAARAVLPPGLDDTVETSLFIAPENDNALYLAPLILYEQEENLTWIANGIFNLATQKLEFMEYYNGRVCKKQIAKYSHEPVPRKDWVKDVTGFKVEEPSQDITLVQRHNGTLIQAARAAIKPGTWKSFELLEQNGARVSKGAGVYCLVSHSQVAGLEAHRIIGYVGRSSDLQKRFCDYLAEKKDPDGRDAVRQFLNNYPKVYFWYVMVEKLDDQKNLEDWLIKAIDPPGNYLLKTAATTTEN